MSKQLDIFIPLELTPERIARHRAWVDDYVATIRSMWIRGGEDADSPEGVAALRVVERSMLVEERPAWMSPGMAIATVTTFPDGNGEVISNPGQHLDGRDALRTLSAMTDDERSKLVASVMGITPERVKASYARMGVGNERTAVYRHYDARGTLLYVGASSDPAVRADQHQRRTRWARLSTRMTTEWYSSKVEALQAEADAIRAELPLFNINELPRGEQPRALDYLFELLAEAEAAATR